MVKETEEIMEALSQFKDSSCIFSNHEWWSTPSQTHGTLLQIISLKSRM